MPNSIKTIYLDDIDDYILEEEVSLNDDRGSSFTRKLLIPVESDAFQKDSRSGEVYVAELYLGEQTELRGSITIETVEINRENEDNEGTVGEFNISFDEEAIDSLGEQGALPLAIRPTLTLADSARKRLRSLSPETEREEEVVPCLSQVTEVDPLDEDEEVSEFEYFFIPEGPKRGTQKATSNRKSPSEAPAFLYENILETEFESKIRSKGDRFFGKGRKVKLRFLEGSLKKELKKILKIARKEKFTDDEFYTFIVNQLVKLSAIQEKAKRLYKIKRYEPHPSRRHPLVEIKAEKIDTSQKTLILIPGTFARSLKETDKKFPWRGSFKFFMKPTSGYKDFFQLITEKTDYKQILTLEHDTFVHDAYDNLFHFSDFLNLQGVRFEKPVALISSSRGGIIAKLMSLIATGEHPDLPYNRDHISLTEDSFHLEPEKLVTVASGSCGYLDGAKQVKKGIQLFFSITNFINPAVATLAGGLLSLGVELLVRMPGLRIMVEGSPEFKVIEAGSIPGLYSLPIANNHTAEKLSIKGFVEKWIVDKFLGEKNDYVISYKSQKDARPGSVLTEFPVVKGGAIHGKGLKDEKVRKKIFDFLCAIIEDGVVVPADKPVQPTT
ncbi:MAG: hypothetical protein AAF655_19770 [Bacteroidota bacterium]